jgi:hypothetical protein
MKHTILTPEYEAVFVDTTKYPPSTPFLLRGLAAALQDANADWRPAVSELVAALRPHPDPMPLVSAGSAYGAGKQIESMYPGPAILLFGAAINALGKAPNVPLRNDIQEAKEILRSAGILDVDPIKAVINAASERASFDKVTEMLRREFEEGMRASGQYPESRIASMVPQIVNATHDTRHRAILGRWVWSESQLVEAQHTFSDDHGDTIDTMFREETEGEQLLYGIERLSPLVAAARIACAHAIAKRLLPYRIPAA